ncbi:MAG: MFS transporter [Elusimicrobiales bacterium]|nr:MFS transporter [Elusimicrobiales bacterium]
MKHPYGIWLLTCSNTLMAAGWSLSMPFFAMYLSVERGVPMSLTGIFLALSMLFSSLGQGLGGELSDALGRRKVMIFSLAARGLMMFLMALAIYLRAHYMWLVAVHVLSGFTGMLFEPASQAWVADQTAPRQRLTQYGLLRIGRNLGWALGPMLGGFVAAKSYALMFLFSGVAFAVVTAIVTLFIRDCAVQKSSRRAGLSEMALELKNLRFARLCALGFMMSTVMSQLVVGLSLYCAKYLGYPQGSIGLLFTINGLVVVFLQYPANKLMLRVRLSQALAVGALFYAAGYFMVGFAGVYLWTAAGVFVLSLGEIIVSPGMQTVGSNIAPPHKKGRYLGMQGLAQQAGAAFGIFLGGTGMELIAPSWRMGPWLLITLIAVCSALGFYAMRKHLSAEEDGLHTPIIEEKEMDF